MGGHHCTLVRLLFKHTEQITASSPPNPILFVFCCAAARYGRSSQQTIRNLVCHPGGKAPLSWGESKHNRSALHVAVWQGHIETVRVLLEMGANPNLIEKDGSSSLHKAAYGGSYGYEKEKSRRKKRYSSTLVPTELTRYESDIIPFEEDNIDEASRRMEILQMLLNCGRCQIDMVESHGCTPLWYAAAQGWTRGTELLVEAGACLNTKYHIPAEYCNEYSPLEIAMRHGHFETARFLLHRGAHLTEDGLESILASKQPLPKDLLKEITTAVPEPCLFTRETFNFAQGEPCHTIPKSCLAHR